MKRPIVKLCVFLLLGAVVNVAVAWGLALVTPFGSAALRNLVDVAQFESADQHDQHWYATQYPFTEPPRDEALSIRSATIDSVKRLRSVGAEQCCFWSQYNTDRDYSMVRIHRMRTGLPLLSNEGALWEAYRLDGGRLPSDIMACDVATLSLLSSASLKRVLPLRMLWPGFAINTFVYAAFLWMLFAGPGSVRRWRRNRRGLCATCAYPIGTSDVCTECGAAREH